MESCAGQNLLALAICYDWKKLTHAYLPGQTDQDGWVFPGRGSPIVLVCTNPCFPQEQINLFAIIGDGIHSPVIIKKE